MRSRKFEVTILIGVRVAMEVSLAAVLGDEVIDAGLVSEVSSCDGMRSRVSAIGFQERRDRDVGVFCSPDVVPRFRDGEEKEGDLRGRAATASQKECIDPREEQALSTEVLRGDGNGPKSNRRRPGLGC